MSSLLTADCQSTHRTAASPIPDPPLTADQARRARQELMRRLRTGGTTLFSTPLTEAEVAAVMDCSERTVRYGVAEAKMLREALRGADAE